MIDPSNHWNLLFDVGGDISSLMFWYYFFIFFHLGENVRFDKATYLSSIFQFILSERLNISLCVSAFMLILESIIKASIFYYKCTEFIIFLYTFLTFSFGRYKEYMIGQISFHEFSDVIPVFTYWSAIGNLWSISLRVNILSSAI